MVAIILAAGYGTRLYPLTLDKPKALLKVGGKTILNRLIEEIADIKECQKVFIISNAKFYKNFEGKLSTPDVEVVNDGTMSNEMRLGAIGDINFVLSKKNINDDLLITGSDNLFESKLKDFVEFAITRRPFSSIMLFDIKDKELAKKYGIVSLDKDLKLTDFEEKPASPKSTLAAACMYFIPKEKTKMISDYMKTALSKDAPGNLIKWLTQKDRVFGYVTSGAWYDIGDKESLGKADEEFRRKEI